IHNFVLTAFLQCLPTTSATVIENFVPAHALPSAFSALTRAPQGVKDAFRIIHLVDGCGPFGTVASAAAGMRRIAFELLDAHLIFIDVGQESTSRFAVEADGRNQRVVLLN